MTAKQQQATQNTTVPRGARSLCFVQSARAGRLIYRFRHAPSATTTASTQPHGDVPHHAHSPPSPDGSLDLEACCCGLSVNSTNSPGVHSVSLYTWHISANHNHHHGGRRGIRIPVCTILNYVCECLVYTIMFVVCKKHTRL